MDTPKQPQKAAPLLDELESIRKLLGDDTLQPPLLTETVASEGQIPMLFDMVGSKTKAEVKPEVVAAPVVAPIPAPVAVAAEPAKARNQDALLHLDSELRAAAQLIMQDVIDDFAPHIETEIKRRLDARMERLLAAVTKGSDKPQA
ncbi:DNA polymerase III subunit chi [Pseudomonas gingeri]|uniref:DNA polymerase III subunit chi n=1 Tax=Pseudomonas gingeri TaxID=117681 RepID=UPI0015A144BC|nr:DNA polymerase III subunit chi [Pseudomonas gingeri]NWA23532.1 DNA polymerase III subunit chi [Pseudomonas gingeri]NWD68369.1 DNA polymerase III subunit chi [Pseudomonas gingeri]